MPPKRKQINGKRHQSITMPFTLFVMSLGLAMTVVVGDANGLDLVETTNSIGRLSAGKGSVGVNQHALLQVKIDIKVQDLPCSAFNSESMVQRLEKEVQWSITLEEVVLSSQQPSKSGSMSADEAPPQFTDDSSLVEMEQSLSLEWSVEASSYFKAQGSTVVSFLLPLVADSSQVSSTTRTLVVALWEDTSRSSLLSNNKKRKRLLERRLTHVPRTRFLYNQRQRHGHLPLDEGDLWGVPQSSIKPYTVVNIVTKSRYGRLLSENTKIPVSIFHFLTNPPWLLVFGCVLMLAASFQMTRNLAPKFVDVVDEELVVQVNPQSNEQEPCSPESDGLLENDEQEDDEVEDDDSNLPYATEGGDEDDEYNNGARDGVPQDHLRHDNTGNTGDDEWWRADREGDESNGNRFVVENTQLLLSWSLQRDLRSSSSSTDDELAPPPPMERHVVRPMPSRGIFFEDEIERFNNLNLSSPFGTRTTRSSSSNVPEPSRVRRVTLGTPRPLSWGPAMLFNSPGPARRRSSLKRHPTPVPTRESPTISTPLPSKAKIQHVSTVVSASCPSQEADTCEKKTQVSPTHAVSHDESSEKDESSKLAAKNDKIVRYQDTVVNNIKAIKSSYENAATGCTVDSLNTNVDSLEYRGSSIANSTEPGTGAHLPAQETKAWYKSGPCEEETSPMLSAPTGGQPEAWPIFLSRQENQSMLGPTAAAVVHDPPEESVRAASETSLTLAESLGKNGKGDNETDKKGSSLMSVAHVAEDIPKSTAAKGGPAQEADLGSSPTARGGCFSLAPSEQHISTVIAGADKTSEDASVAVKDNLVSSPTAEGTHFLVPSELQYSTIIPSADKTSEDASAAVEVGQLQEANLCSGLSMEGRLPTAPSELRISAVIPIAYETCEARAAVEVGRLQGANLCTCLTAETDQPSSAPSEPKNISFAISSPDTTGEVCGNPLKMKSEKSPHLLSSAPSEPKIISFAISSPETTREACGNPLEMKSEKSPNVVSAEPSQNASAKTVFEQALELDKSHFLGGSSNELVSGRELCLLPSSQQQAECGAFGESVGHQAPCSCAKSCESVDVADKAPPRTEESPALVTQGGSIMAEQLSPAFNGNMEEPGSRADAAETCKPIVPADDTHKPKQGPSHIQRGIKRSLADIGLEFDSPGAYNVPNRIVSHLECCGDPAPTPICDDVTPLAASVEICRINCKQSSKEERTKGSQFLSPMYSDSSPTTTSQPMSPECGNQDRSRDYAKEWGSFTYHSTLSHDPTSSSELSEGSGNQPLKSTTFETQEREIVKEGPQNVGAGNKAGGPTNEHSVPVSRVLVRRKKRSRRNEAEASAAKSVGVLPEVVPSHSLAQIAQEVSAPSWEFKEEEVPNTKRKKQKSPCGLVICPLDKKGKLDRVGREDRKSTREIKPIVCARSGSDKASRYPAVDKRARTSLSLKQEEGRKSRGEIKTHALTQPVPEENGPPFHSGKGGSLFGESCTTTALDSLLTLPSICENRRSPEGALLRSPYEIKACSASIKDKDQRAYKKKSVAKKSSSRNNTQRGPMA